MSSISFKFSQSRERIQLPSRRVEEEEAKEYLDEVDTRKGLQKKKDKDSQDDDLVIPCPGDSLEAKAIQELLKGSNDSSEGVSLPSGASRDLVIYQASLAKAGTDTSKEDYESVPIEKFGMAMLKGMGWTPESKKTVPTLEAQLRPKGLGLGAALPKKMKDDTPSSNETKTDNEEKELEMVVGAYVLIGHGTHKSKYGQITGFNEDTGRAYVKLTLSSETFSISENGLTLVSKKEYKVKGKVLNQDEYDRHAKKKKKRSRSRSPLPSNPLYEKEEQRKRSNKELCPSPAPRKKGPSWAVAPHLRVRFINESYKGGRYFNAKMIVQDVTTPTTCVLKCESDGRILDQVSLSDLETVIPKSSSRNQKVMIVRSVGTARKGTLASILSKDKDRCKAVVQSIYDKKDVWNLDFDDMCEYFGEVNDEY